MLCRVGESKSTIDDKNVIMRSIVQSMKVELSFTACRNGYYVLACCILYSDAVSLWAEDSIQVHSKINLGKVLLELECMVDFLALVQPARDK